MEIKRKSNQHLTYQQLTTNTMTMKSPITLESPALPSSAPPPPCLSHRDKHPRRRIHGAPASRPPVVARPHRLVPDEGAVAQLDLSLPEGGDGAPVVLGDVPLERRVSHAHKRAAAGAPRLRGAIDLHFSLMMLLFREIRASNFVFVCLKK